MKKVRNVLIILPVLCLVFAACGGSAIGDAQQFEPNEPPVIHSIKAVNFDGSEITQLDIEPYKQFKLIVEATDPDNNPLEYKFDSASGTFAGISGNSSGCTAIFKTGSVKGGQSIDLWAGVSDGKGAIVRQSYNLGTGKLGPAITAILDKTIVRPDESIKLSVTANCSGFFQLNLDGSENFDFEKDMFRYSYSENKTTDFILGGPEFISFADIQLKKTADNKYPNGTAYNIVIVFRDGLLQNSKFKQTIYVDGTGPEIFNNNNGNNNDDGFSPTGTGISTNPAVIVTFDEEIGYADSSCLKLTPDHGEIKLASISGNKAYFSVTGLETLQEYNAVVSGIKDIAGNPMLPDSTYSFKTRSDGNTKFFVADASTGLSEYSAYCGFENDNSTVTLIATLDGTINSGALFSCADSDVSISDNKITVKAHDLKYDTAKNITVTAISSNNDKAEFIVNIEPFYPIRSATRDADLVMITKNLNGRFKLMENIDINDNNSNNMYPIGSYTDASVNSPFTGIFDGGGNTLSNFKILAGQTNDKNYAGLFAYNKGTIKNLKVDNALFNKDNIDYVGIICGLNSGNIENCHLNGIEIYADSNAGGIAGFNTGSVKNCSSTGEGIVKVKSTVAKAGGLIGYSKGGTVSGCKSSISVDLDTNPSYKNDFAIGGLIGYVENATITDCSSSGTVYAPNAYNVGGLIGYSINGQISGSTHSTGQVTGYGWTGGLIGSMAGGSVKGTSNSPIYSSAEVDGESHVGGLIGSLSNSSEISYCTSSGVVRSLGSENFNYIGGLIGYAISNTDNINISNCSSSGNLFGGNADYVGGLIGYASSSANCKMLISNSYSTRNVTGKDNVGGLIGMMIDSELSGIKAEGTIPAQYAYSKGEVRGVNYVGGLVGNIKANNPGYAWITYCCSESNVTGTKYVGGLVGFMEGNLMTGNPSIGADNSYSTGVVKGDNDAGGLIGSIYYKAIISKCYSESNISLANKTTETKQYFGGLIGSLFLAVTVVEDSYSTGKVLENDTVSGNVGGLIGGININSGTSGTSSILRCYHTTGAVAGRDNIGGLIGFIVSTNSSKNATVDQCFASCEVKANNSNAGGLIGTIINYTDISNCYSMGSVSINSSYVGGLIGYIENGNNSTVSKCYTTATVQGNSYKGLFIGYVKTPVTISYNDCYYLDNTLGIPTYGIPKTQSELQRPFTFDGWDISNSDNKIWKINIGLNGGYPFLRENPPQ